VSSLSELEAYRAGWLGDFRPARQLVDPSPAARALLGAQRYLAEAAEPPTWPRITSEDPLAGLVALEWTRIAVLASDRPLLARALALAGTHPESLLGRAWLAWMDGAAEGASIAAEAFRHLDGPARIDAVSLRALALLEQEDAGEALSLARRAVRMSRADEFPQAQYLAGLALARCRRMRGRPHLSMHVLAPLERVASAPWRDWIRWETFGAGAHDEALLEAARAGDRERFAARARALASRAGSCVPFQRDLASWLAVLDPAAASPPSHVEFLTGRSDEVPSRARGLCAGLEGEMGVLIIIHGDRPPRRCAAAAEGLAFASASGPRRELPTGRTLLGLCCVALAGGRIDRETFFRRVYGFGYNAPAHRGTLKVLVHRIREWLGEAGGIVLEENGDLVLELRRSLVLPDPRCETPLGDRLLRHLAVQRRGGARQLAGELGVSVRTAQRALVELAEEGSVVRAKDGRGFSYAVEDSVFTEPTRWRTQ